MKLPCYIVRDLLPLYKDALCDAATAADIEEHLKECGGCAETLRALSEPDETAAPAEGRKGAAELLRKIKKKLRVQRVLAAVAALAVIFGLGVYAHAFVTVGFTEEDIGAVREELCLDKPEGAPMLHLVADCATGRSVDRMSAVRATVTITEGRDMEVVVFACASNGLTTVADGITAGDISNREITVICGSEDINAVFLCPWESYEGFEQMASAAGNMLHISELPEYLTLLWSR